MQCITTCHESFDAGYAGSHSKPLLQTAQSVLQQQGMKPIQFQADTQEFAEREAQAISKQHAF